MARKKKQPAHDNHDRWLISYADFITLLFAFFVVMFASSQVDKGKAQQISESIQRALKHDKVSDAIANILGGAKGKKEKGNAQRKGSGGAVQAKSKPAPSTAELTPSMELLKKALQREIDRGMLQVSMEARGLVISLRQAAFFPSGQDTIDPGTYDTIAKVAETVLKLPNKVRLEGHTDSVPIRTARYRSNWELATARGVTMLELLSARYAVPEKRLSVGGYAETIPIETNDTNDGRAHNRRVDIVILNETGVMGEPLAKSQPLAGSDMQAKSEAPAKEQRAKTELQAKK